MSKRAWDGRVKQWRLALHAWANANRKEASAETLGADANLEQIEAEALGDDANLEDIDAMLDELENDDGAAHAGRGAEGVDRGGHGVEEDDDDDLERGAHQDSFRYFDDELDETHLIEGDDETA